MLIKQIRSLSGKTGVQRRELGRGIGRGVGSGLGRGLGRG